MLMPHDTPPNWWDPAGDQRHLQQPTKNRPFTVGDRLSTLRIFESNNKQGRWRVEWEIIHPNKRGADSGFRFFDDDDLAIAFCLKREEIPANAKHLIACMGAADRIRIGYFIGKLDFLSIPCPGTGHPGDPNFPFRITMQMQNRIREMICIKAT